jgi:hypothetical protein
VGWFVQWGSEQRRLEGFQAIGVDENHCGKGQKADNFLTVIYQMDRHCRRLLWVGKRRTQATLRRRLVSVQGWDELPLSVINPQAYTSAPVAPYGGLLGWVWRLWESECLALEFSYEPSERETGRCLLMLPSSRAGLAQSVY